MWWRDEHIVRDLRSGDIGARHMVLTLLHSHHQELDSFVTRHPAFFFRAMVELIQRYEENYEVKRKVWSVLTALVNLHSKIHVQELLFEHGVFGLALETLGGAYGQDQGFCCVSEVLEFLLALKNDNIRLFDLDPHVVQRLTGLPVRLDQGIGRFGYKLLIQLLRDLQVIEGGARAESVDQHTVELIDRAGPTTFLILVERILEETRSYFAPHDAGTMSVTPHSHSNWPSLSSWHLGALLSEVVEVLRTTQGEATISSFDRVIALKWLQANSAAITAQFQESQDLSELLNKVASDNANSRVTQRLVDELVGTLATQRTDPMVSRAPTSQASMKGPRTIVTWHLSAEMQDALYKLQHGDSEQKLQAINYFTTSNAVALADGAMVNLHVVSTALRVLADLSTPESVNEQIWKMLATAVTKTQEGTSATCAQEYYELVCVALQVLVDDTESTNAGSRCGPWAVTLLVGPLRGVCFDEVARNGSSWRNKSPYAGAAIATLLVRQLERADAQEPGEAKRIWGPLSRNLETMESEVVAHVIFQSEVLAVAAQTVRVSNDFCRVNVSVLGFVDVLIRKQALPAESCIDWAKIALKFAASTMVNPASREFLVHFLKESVTNYPECAREIKLVVPNLVQQAAEQGYALVELIGRLISTQTAPLLPIPRVIHMLTTGNAFEKLIMLRHLESFSVLEFRDFLCFFSGLAVLHHLVLHGEASQPVFVKKLVMKMVDADLSCKAQVTESQLRNPDAAFISQMKLGRIDGSIPVDLANLCQELRSTFSSGEPGEILRHKVINILQLVRNESVTDIVFLSCMRQLFSPPIYAALWRKQAYSLPESEALTQVALRVLELDGTFQYREQFGSTQETLVLGIPLLTQRLSEEQSANAADSLTNLLHKFASTNHDMSSCIGQSIQRIMDESEGNNGVIYYQNLLAVYRKHDGVMLGKLHGRHEIPSLTAIINILSTGHALEKLITLKLMRKHIPILPATLLPLLLLEAVPTIFGLTLGLPQNQSVAKEVLAELSKKDSRCEAIVSQFQAPLTMSVAPSPWVLRYQRVPTRSSDSTLGKSSTRSLEEIQETEPEDEHTMYDSDGGLRFMYSDYGDSDGDDTIEGYAACEDRKSTCATQESAISRS